MQKKILTIILLLTLFITITFAVISFYIIKKSVEQLEANQQSIACTIASSVDYMLEENINKLYDISLTRLVNFDKNNSQIIYELLKDTYHHSLFTEGLFILDKNSKIFKSYPTGFNSKENYNFKPFVDRAINDNRLIVTPLVRSKNSNKALIYTIVPLKDINNEIIGAIIGIANLKNLILNKFLKNIDIGKNNYIEIIDINENILASNREEFRLKRFKYVSNVSIKDVIKNKSRCLSKFSIINQYRKEHHIKFAITSLKYAPWAVMFGYSSTVFFTPLKNLISILTAIILIYILVGIIFSTGLSTSITKPVHELIDEIDNINRGDYSKPVMMIGSNEILVLCESFENMRLKLVETLNNLKDYNVKLENEVNKRTKEIEKNKNRIESLLGLIMTSQEEERKRIARELHDEPLQNISVILMQLNSFKQFHDTKSTEELINKIKDLLLKTNSNIRLIIQNLRPSVLDDLGLISAIKWVLENYLTPQGILYFFDYEGNIEDKRFSTFIETNIYRIVQEAIANICRHSQANEVHIKLIKKKYKLIITIIDDGIGFDVNKIIARDINKRDDLKGIGILGMYERATLLGGVLSIISKVNNGTKITLTVPLDEDGNG
jgi:signal transduction histidine kinase